MPKQDDKPLSLTPFMSQGEYWQRSDGELVPVERMDLTEAMGIVRMMEDILARLWPQARAIDSSVGELAAEVISVDPSRESDLEGILSRRLTLRYESPVDLLDAQPLYRALKRRIAQLGGDEPFPV